MNHPKHIDPRLDPTRVIRAPRGSEKTCKTWLAEAAYRMIQNNLDPEVAENPHELVVYGGIGRAARNWECYDKIVATLKELEDDETLLVQSGKPVGVFKTHANAPRVLIANSNLVPHWATWEHFNELDRKGLAMYGQMTAGSWIYIGSQGIVQGTYETFVAVASQHYNGSLQGPLGADRRPGRHGRRAAAGRHPGRRLLAEHRMPAEPHRFPPENPLRRRAGQEARRRAGACIEKAKAKAKPVSIALLGNAAEILPELVARGVRPDMVTDQTSAHDPLNGYLPQGWSVEQWHEARKVDPQSIVKPPPSSRWPITSRPCWRSSRWAWPTFDYGNNIRQMAKEMGVDNAFDFPGFVPAYIRPLFCRGIGPFRWVALSGDPAGHLQNRRQGEGADPR